MPLTPVPAPEPRTIDLILVGEGPAPRWPLGSVERRPATPRDVAEALSAASHRACHSVLLWDPALGAPDPAVVEELSTRTIEVFHAGLSLGQGNRPRAVDFIEPLWMHNCDAPAAIESTSWRLSFRACLIRRSVLEQMRGPHTEFHSLDAAALEIGFHWLRRGVFVRHTPRLVRDGGLAPEPLDAHDELLFASRCFSVSWTRWAAARGVLTGAWSSLDAARFASAAHRQPAPAHHFVRTPPPARRSGTERVSVLVPTVERYPYLRVLLAQLRAQTVRPHEVIVIDQTPAADRDAGLPGQFADLPLRWITLDRAGQCSSRNAGLLVATGDHVLFIDDDDEVQATLLERHLDMLARYDSEASCGVAIEDGIPALPENFRFTRSSDVFPTNNTMIRTELLRRTGLFDLAYDRQQRADADLGMRAHLAGAFIVLDPSIEVIHHHAPRGGLRKHKARVVTYASSRSTVWQRHLPSASEIYLGGRYFGPARVRELVWQKALGTLSSHGSTLHKLAKGSAGALLLLDTVRKMQATQVSARELVARPAQIPQLP